MHGDGNISINYVTTALNFACLGSPRVSLIFRQIETLFCIHHLTVRDLFISKYQPSKSLLKIYSWRYLVLLSYPYHRNLKVDPHNSHA